MCKKAADDDRLSNRTHGSDLPPSWRTLYELTKLDDATFDAALESGAIRPDMKREDVNRIRPARLPVHPSHASLQACATP